MTSQSQRRPGRTLKKTGAAALGAALVALSLTACGGSQAATTTQDSGPATLTVWTWEQPAKALNAAVPAFEKANPGVKVDIQTVGNPAIWDKITTGMAAGGSGLPDIMNIGADYMSNYVETFPNGFANLSTLGAKDLAGDFPEGLWKGAQNAAGDQFGVPMEINMNLLYYRADLFKQIGVDMDKITTWDQLLDAGKKLKAQTGADLFALDKAASQADAANVWQMLARLQSSFFFNAQGDISFNGKGGVAAMTFLKEANDAGIVADVPMSQGTTSQVKGQVKVAIMPGASWMTSTFQQNAPEMKGKWAVRGLPAMQEGGLTAASAGGTYLAVAGSSKHQQQAYNFVKYALASDEGQQSVYKDGGLFPSYEPMWKDKAFSAEDSYFGINANKLVIDALSEDLPTDNYTADYAKALKAFTDAQSQVLISGTDPQKALDDAANLLAQQTQRKVAQS